MSERLIRHIEFPELDWSGVSSLRSRIESLGVAIVEEGAVLLRPRVRGWRRILCLLTFKSPPVITLTGRIDPSCVTPEMEEIPVFYDSLQAAAEAVKREGSPFHYELVLRGKLGEKYVKFNVDRTGPGRPLIRNESLLFDIDGLTRKTADTLMDSLGVDSSCDRWHPHPQI